MFYISGFCLCFFIDFCAAVISPLFWLLHPRTFSTWTCRYKHGGNEQQSEERGCMYTDRPHVLLVVEFATSSSLHPSYFFLPLSFFCLKESLCGQRGLLPNTDTQTFQVSLTSRLRSQYDRIRESFSRVWTLSVEFVNESYNIKPREKTIPHFQFKRLFLVSSTPEKWAITADGCMLG